MAAGNLSPRQRMINMMYLVLTALLALNVSKEVLNSFFEVNKGITRSTTNFNTKNIDTYAAFDAAAELNPVKAGPYREQAYEIKAEADKLVAFLQEMKYKLVFTADKGKVYLGPESEFKDAEGELIEEKAIVVPWEQLTNNQKILSIGELNAKDDRNTSGELFYSDKRKNNVATDLKSDLNAYKMLLLDIAEGNESLITSINETCNYDDKKVKGKKQLWEKYNFYDMPSVGALTLLSKMQSDVRNTEADIISMLKENIEANSLKFTSADAMQVSSNFVLRGDSFRAQIFISAKDTTQDPMIYVGEYDSLGNGDYQMKGTEGVDYNAVRVINGKGIFSERASSEGMKKWGGLIAMKTSNGTKMYPFNGEYLVAAKTAVVSPTKMNILYIGCDNPISVSVAGYTDSQVSASMSGGGKFSRGSKKGEYIAKPTEKGMVKITVYASVDGKRTNMGSLPFRVKTIPSPVAFVRNAKNTKKGWLIDKSSLVSTGSLSAKFAEEFMFDGIQWKVVGFTLAGMYKGKMQDDRASGSRFTSRMKGIINNARPGSTISISGIRVKRSDGYGEPRSIDSDLVIKLK